MSEAQTTKAAMIPARLRKPEYRFIILRRGDKAPIEKKWASENNYRHDNPRLVRHLLEGGNYGVVGGYGNLAIIDADKPEVMQAIKDNLPATFVVKSGSKGYHYYYLVKNFTKPIRLFGDKGAGSAGDVQSWGKQAVGAGSLHPNGNVYSVVEDNEIAEVNEEQVRFALREFIDIKNEIVTGLAKQKPFTIEQVFNVATLTQHGDEYYGSHPLHGSTNGNNFWVNTAKQTWFCFRCSVGGDAWTLLAMMENILPCENDCRAVTKGCLRKKEVWLKVLETARRKGLIPRGADDFDVADHVHLARAILQDYKFITTMDDDACYLYQDGVYLGNAEARIKQVLETLTDGTCTDSTRREVIGHIKAATYVQAEDMNRSSSVVNVSNGLLDLSTGELKSHSPTYHSTMQVPVTFDASADCPNFKKFLAEVLNEEDIPIVQELFGYCLAQTHVIHKAFLFTGGGRNGKSTLLSVLKTFLGAHNVSSVSIQNLSNNQFALSDLRNKLANIFPDLPQKPIEDSGVFKGLVGEDLMRAERKYGQPFQLMNTAKLVFSCNSIPRNEGDDSDAFFYRWIIINCDKTFTGKKAVKGLAKQLCTESELSGVLNWAVAGFTRLFAQQDFSYDKQVEQVRAEYLRKSDPAAAFINDCVVEDGEGWVEKQVLYAALSRYCRDNKLVLPYEQRLSKDLLRLLNVRDGQKRFDDYRVRVWFGIVLKQTPPGEACHVCHGWHTQFAHCPVLSDTSKHTTKEKLLVTCVPPVTGIDGDAHNVLAQVSHPDPVPTTLNENKYAHKLTQRVNLTTKNTENTNKGGLFLPEQINTNHVLSQISTTTPTTFSHIVEVCALAGKNDNWVYEQLQQLKKVGDVVEVSPDNYLRTT